MRDVVGAALRLDGVALRLCRGLRISWGYCYQAHRCEQRARRCRTSPRVDHVDIPLSLSTRAAASTEIIPCNSSVSNTARGILFRFGYDRKRNLRTRILPRFTL